MEMPAVFYYLVVSVVISSVPYSAAKTVSLNELIAAESRQREALKDTAHQISAKRNLVREDIARGPQKRKNSGVTETDDKSEIKQEVSPTRTKVKKVSESKAASDLTSKLRESTTKRPSKQAPVRGGKRNKTVEGRLLDSETGISSLIRKLIGKESKRKQGAGQYRSPAKYSGKSGEAERFSLNKLLFRDPKRREFQITELITPRGKKLLSSLKYRKRFQIKSPLKPKKVGYLQRPRHKYKNQSVKRQVKNERFDKKYIPLLRSLSMLFDNVLNAEPEDVTSAEQSTGTEGTSTSKDIANKKHTGSEENERTRGACSCATKPDAEAAESRTVQEATVATAGPEVPTPEAIQAPPAAADHTADGDVSSVRPHTDLPLLPAGNTTGAGRDDTGLGERSGATLHGGAQGNITRHHGDSEHNPRSGEESSGAANDEADPDSAARDGTNGGPSGRGVLGDSDELRGPVYRGSYEVQETEIVEEDFVGLDGRNITEIKREDIFKTGGDEVQSATALPELVQRLGRHVSQDSVSNDTEPLQSKENHEEGLDNVEQPVPGHKRLAGGDGSSPAEVEETGPADETTITLEDLSDPIRMLRAGPKGEAPYVTIIDGYSVARDINGKNKMSEHAVRFHT